VRILLTCNHLVGYGGAEKFVMLLAQGFREFGHEVFLYAEKNGRSYSDAISAGAQAHSDAVGYDVSFYTHNSTVSIGSARVRIQICHGIFPYLEQPVTGMDGYIAVSEEVQERLRTGGIRAVVIKNPVVKNFSTTVSEDVLSVCQGSEANEVLSEICKELQVKLTCRNKHSIEEENIELLMSSCAVVIGTGRSVIEAFSVGKPAICFDSRHYDGLSGFGLLTRSNVRTGSYSNFSGRGIPVVGYENLKCDIKLALKEGVDSSLLEYLQENHEYRVVATQFLKYASRHDHGWCRRFRRCFRRSRVIDLRTESEIRSWSNPVV
jgi:hypothetical protein